MGIKFARALGAEVTVFTRSDAKVAEAKRQGADRVIVSSDEAQMSAAAGSLDYILDTVPVQHDLNPYLQTLSFDGTHILVGLLEPIDPPVEGGQLVILRRARHHLRDRDAGHRRHQRRLRAREARRGEVPLRDRHGDAERICRLIRAFFGSRRIN
jgi:NADPH:quinone reductase-like Zn-dependent oxidoreductase